MKHLMICAVLLAMLTGCKTVQYVEVEKVRIDTTYITKWQHDSIWKHDSVYVKEYTHGDTVYLVRDRWHTQYVEKFVRDTCYQSRVDSIPVPYPKIEYIEKKLSTPQKGLMTVGFLSLLGFLLFIVSKVKRYLP